MTKEKVLEIFRKNVKRTRLERNLTIKKLAAKSGIRKEYLQKIEEAKAPEVSTRHLFLLAEALKIMPHMFLKDY